MRWGAQRPMQTIGETVTLGPRFPEVLAAAQRGEEVAFAALYRDLNPLVLRYLAAHDRRGSDDLAAETWLAAARGLGRFTGAEEAFRGWIFTIAHRRLIEHWRHNGHRPAEVLSSDPAPSVCAPDDTEGSGLAHLTGQEAVSLVCSLLPPDQADVVLLRVLAGLDASQVAEILGKRPGTVRVLQHRALRRLAGKLSPELLTQ